jgi:hypothetical protein
MAQFTATGTVTGVRTNEPVIGATVLVKSTTIGTATNTEEQFSINVPTQSATLTFSYVGYLLKEVEVTSSSGPITV